MDIMTTAKASSPEGVVPGALHLATDHLLEPTLSALSGSDVTLSGTKADGTPFRTRTLTNVSFRPNGTSGVHVIGMEPGVGIRQFDLGRIDRMESSGLAFDRQAVLAMLDRSILELTRRSEGGGE